MSLQQIGFKGSEYERPDQVWLCGRRGEPCPYGPSRRGRCSQQDSPCQPARSIRSLRGRVTLAAVGLTVAGVLLAFSDRETRRKTILPGELTTNHAALVEHCEACHSSAEIGPAGWFGASFSTERAEVDSKRCIACHDFGNDGLRAHTLPPDHLETWSERAEHAEGGRTDLLMQAAGELSEWQTTHDKLACATCHREHQGRAQDLTAMSNQKCQVCHTNRFESLANGHPEFTDYGQDQAGRIHFTHAEHFEGPTSHFTDQNVPVPACAECHAPDAAGRHMLLQPNTFDAWCNRCHGGEGTFGPVVLFNLPPAPAAWLETIGEYPVARELGGDLDKDAVPPSKAMRFFIPRLKDSRALKSLVGSLEKYADDQDLFPEEEDSDGDDADGDDDDDDGDDDGDDDDDDGDDDDDDEEKKPWDGKISPDIRLTACEGDANKAQEAQRREELLFPPARNYVWEAKELLNELASARDDPARLRKRLRGLGARGQVVDAFVEVVPVPFFQEVRRKWLPGVTGLEDRRSASKAIRVQDPAVTDPRPDPLGGEWKATAEFEITYSKYRHQDPFLKAWLDLATGMQQTSEAPSPLLEVFKTRCAKCHVVNGPRVPGPSWGAAYKNPREQTATFFAHRPHVRLEGQDCSTCHVQGPTAKPTLSSDFTLERYGARQSCVDCHTPTRAGNSCLQCHNYHVGVIPKPTAPDMSRWTGR